VVWYRISVYRIFVSYLVEIFQPVPELLQRQIFICDLGLILGLHDFHYMNIICHLCHLCIILQYILRRYGVPKFFMSDLVATLIFTSDLQNRTSSASHHTLRTRNVSTLDVLYFRRYGTHIFSHLTLQQLWPLPSQHIAETKLISNNCQV